MTMLRNLPSVNMSTAHPIPLETTTNTALIFFLQIAQQRSSTPGEEDLVFLIR